MKKQFIVAFIICLNFVANLSFAQHTAVKIGYTNADEILSALPEAKTINSELTSYKTQLETQFKSMEEDLKKKYQDYMAKAPSLAPAVKESKEKELQTLQQNMKDFEEKAQSDLQKKQQTLLQPVYEKIQKAIEELAKAEHFTHIFSSDVSGYPILLFGVEEYDITNKIIVKLGGTVPTKQPATTPTTGK
jgi:outer membrane protein